MIIGLSGGIGCGKSYAAALFRKQGFNILDADEISKELTSEGSEVLSELRDEFGSAIFHKDGSLDRRRLADIAFSDNQSAKRLEEIVTSKVIDVIKDRITDNTIIDAPLLFETGMENLCDLSVLIIADKQLRIERVQKRSGLSETEILKRMSHQLDDDIKIQKADIVIENNGSKNEFETAVAKLISDIKSGQIGVKYGRKKENYEKQ